MSHASVCEGAHGYSNMCATDAPATLLQNVVLWMDPSSMVTFLSWITVTNEHVTIRNAVAPTTPAATPVADATNV